MKKLLLSLVALTAVSASTLHAQEVTGSWQGTLKAARSLRFVLQVTKDGNVYKGRFFSIDQSPKGFNTGTLVIQPPAFNFTISAFDVTYEGKLSADGKSVTGTWKQGGGAAVPLTFDHVTTEAAWEIPKPQTPLPPMPADADPTFDVATVKPSKPDQPGKMFRVDGRRFTTVNTTLEDMIAFAYAVQQKQIVGAPAWFTTDKFDIEAQPDIPGTPSDKQLKSMLRKLLAERFQLAFHHEKKELSVYVITVGKAGAKLARSEGDPNGLPGTFFRGLGKLTVSNATIADFASIMQATVLDRPVLDQTGLVGRFDFQLNWTPDESQFSGLGIKVPPPSDAADALPNLYTAMQEQIGLKLEPTKAPADVLVIDKAEKPTAN